ncbi:hypothetical protein SAMN04487944_12282 [Gracilibacillus ureilyticus]|uniref:Uncharacterized protein n=1 Tax=Gracilibacillus ureilyticus TaxID=531814 RepID=A0A1H9VBK4_9BACI|nr:hypothetical protein [Gracilibacillus ureilyticus]SES18824.1 hypothetical protein SAMN04487944_12282 [Gracilibacillus ureilyticus]
MSFRTVAALIGSILICSFGLFRLLNETLSATPLFVAYVFIITGLIGAVVNAVKLGKSK